MIQNLIPFLLQLVSFAFQKSYLSSSLLNHLPQQPELLVWVLIEVEDFDFKLITTHSYYLSPLHSEMSPPLHSIRGPVLKTDSDQTLFIQTYLTFTVPVVF